MKKKTFFKIGLFLLITVILVFSYLSITTITNNSQMNKPNKIELAELSDNYKQWLKLSDEEKANTLRPRMFSIKYEDITKNQETKSGNTYASSYDLRTINGVKPVKNQRNWGFCWAFAGTSSLESHMLTRPNSEFNTDLNPMHVGYALSYSFAYDIGNLYGSKSLDYGGNNIDNILYWTSGVGPVSIENFPVTSEEYPIEKSADEVLVQTEDIQVENALLFPEIDMKVATQEQKQEYINTIKQAILDYGAISFASMAPAEGTQGYNSSNNAVYTEEQWEVNLAAHMMLIVGWDDNFSKDNFNAGVTSGHKPTMDGAWIVQNSWGTDNGINGYYYYSYEDYGLNSNDMCAVARVSSIDYDNIYQYNPGGDVRPSTGDYMANIFNKEDGQEKLTEIGFFNFNPNTEYEIYVNPNSGDLDISKAQYVATYRDENEFSEYITITLDEPIDLTGDQFAVIIKIKDDIWGRYNVPLQMNAHNYLLNDEVNIKRGQSFVFYEGEDWVDTAEEFQGSVFIKAFTINSAENTEVIINTSLNKDAVYLQNEIGILATSATKNVTDLNKLDYKIYNSQNEDKTEEFIIYRSSNNNIHYANIIIPYDYALLGDYTLKVSYDGETKSTCDFTIEKRVVTNINLLRDTISLQLGYTNSIASKILLEPKGMPNSSIVYSSDNEDVATVSTRGKVTANNIGTANIKIASADNEEIYSIIKVNVVDLNELLDGEGTEENPYLIKTAEDLNLVRANLSANYKLANDIDLTYDTTNENGEFYNEGRGWEPIGFIQEEQVIQHIEPEVSIEGWFEFINSDPFTGIFDGDGYSINGLNINRPGENFNALFSYVENGTIKNLRIKNGNIKGEYYTAGFAALSINETIENVSNGANISGSNKMAGIVCVARNSNLNKVWNRGNVKQDTFYLEDGKWCTGYTGGITSTLDNSIISMAFNLGDVKTLNVMDTMVSGGITARCGNSTIENCYNSGDVFAHSGCVGGIVGEVPFGNLTIDKTYNIGQVSSSSSWVGDIAGYIDADIVSIDNVYTLQSQINNFGCIAYIDDMENSVLNVYNKTLEELKQKETFVGFDFENVWKTKEDSTPILRINDEEVVVLEGIRVKSLPNKVRYLLNEDDLSIEGLRVVQCYNDGTEEEISVTKEMITGFDNTTPGVQTLTVTYNEFETTFDIEVYKLTLQQIYINGEVQFKSQYIEGECFNIEGLSLAAIYGDESTQNWWEGEYVRRELNISDCEISKTGPLTMEDESIIISYTYDGITKSIEIPIKVYSAQLEGMAGSGTEEDPYLISTPEELNRMRENQIANYKLANDIDMENVDLDGEEWQAIGDWEFHFEGTFDGNNHKISNLTIDNSDGVEDFAVLFGIIENAEIKNLTIDGANLSGRNTAGVVYVAEDSTLSNIKVENSTITSFDNVGGIVEECMGNTVINKCCSINNTITTTGEVVPDSPYGGYGPSVGGIIAYGWSTQITNCYNTSILNGGYRVGGIAGHLEGGSLENTYNTGTINSEYFRGGIIGQSVESILKNSYDILDELNAVGSKVGDNPVLNVVEKTLDELKQKETFIGFDFDDVWKLNPNETPSFEEKIIEDNTSVKYRTHVQDVGWQEWKKDGEMSGTKGRSLRLEGIRIQLENQLLEGGIEYRTHIQNVGWQGWKKDGEMSGTSGQSLRLEAIRIRLTGEIAEEFDVYYRVHAQQFGWLGWAKNGEAAGTEGYGYRLEGIEIKLVKKGEEGPLQNKEAFKIAPTSVTYRTHVQDVGWQEWKKDGEMSGTSGRSLRLEGINIKLDNQKTSGGIEYRTHIQNIGWQEWEANGEMSGTSGQALRLEAIKIRLTGKMAEEYDVYYRVHAQKFGWLGWAKNGEAAGTEGYSYRLEGIEIKLVKKGEAAPSQDKDSYKKAPMTVAYRTHVENDGWQDWRKYGEMSGTEGRGLRLEGICIQLENKTVSGGIEYSTHIQNIGWQNFRANGEMSGTEGQALRLEAIKIRLTGQAAEEYDVYYRVHAQEYGWLGWAKNGQAAGTEGFGYRLEAIEIELVRKGETAPGSTQRAFVAPIQTHRLATVFVTHPGSAIRTGIYTLSEEELGKGIGLYDGSSIVEYYSKQYGTYGNWTLEEIKQLEKAETRIINGVEWVIVNTGVEDDPTGFMELYAVKNADEYCISISYPKTSIDLINEVISTIMVPEG